MNSVCQTGLTRLKRKSVSDWRRSALVLLLAICSLGHVGGAFAVDPPKNIRIENNVLYWDEVDNAANYNIYFLTAYPVSNSVTPRYLATVDRGREFHPTTEGYYTVVANVYTENGLEFSDVAEGEAVSYTGSNQDAATVTINNLYEIRSKRCENVVAGGSCEVHCSNKDRRIPTGGACRADAGVVLHQRARHDSFECISQVDTTFAEADVYCLDTTKFLKR